ncbi:MAG: 16S rRNA (cytosine(1402)-N(4))-methyltransferase RsmH [Nitrospira sp.]|nr:MAG: 16S rRNA (cytosine(1402)-N(4))-methyltransferase RsmH [Nitrospira sp.]
MSLESKENKAHIPVLINEVMGWLVWKPNGRFLDCTVGLGGHSDALLERGGPEACLIGCDRDAEVLEMSRARLHRWGSRVHLVHAHYRDLWSHVEIVGERSFDGILFDLGVSSVQLDDAQRGFSFQSEGPLDMRMDRTKTQTAADLVNTLPEQELADLVYRFGEERYSRRIARAIVRARTEFPLLTTSQLVDVVRRAVPRAYRHGRIHCATRTFQALRIAVNRELDDLGPSLTQAASRLSPGGRVCVIAFHSLEDRIVKQTFRHLASGVAPVLALLTKKPVVALESECDSNPRARSAKLRVAERRRSEDDGRSA